MKQIQWKQLLLIAFWLPLAVMQGCKKDDEEQLIDDTYTPTPYRINIPFGFSEPELPPDNPLTVEGVRLGRMLFYDPILSSNGLTCSSCHPQNLSFSGPFRVNSQGEHVSIPPLINLSWNPDFEWIGQEAVLEHVPLADFGPEFFNTNMDTLVARLKAHQLYPRYFFEAFGINDVSALSDAELQSAIANAIIQFARTIVSGDSKYDRVRRQLAFFTAEEMDGANIFFTERGDCFHCHGTSLLTNNTFNNNGLDELLSGQNLGRYLYTGNPADMGKFSSPTLRNIELTAPYMHDGRFQTLEEVVEFYNSGVNLNSPNIDPIMTKPFKVGGLGLTAQEKADLVAFLKTFTDTSILTNPDYSNPF